MISLPGLVLEGGTFRALFSAGVMDALLDNNIMFPYCIGVSAGISNGLSYLSKQRGRNLDIVQQYRNDKRYISKRNFLRCRSLFGIDFVFNEIPNQLLPFDWDTFLAYEGKVYAGVTNAATGKIEYLDCKENDRKSTILQATCAIPVIFPAIEWKGQKYYDGGLADSIPIKRSIADGNLKNLIVLTQPKGFQKQYSKNYDMVIRLIRNKYPNMVDVLKSRYIHYNDTITYIDQLEKGNDTIILRPDYSLNSMEKNSDAMFKTYQHGYDKAMQNINQIHTLF